MNIANDKQNQFSGLSGAEAEAARPLPAGTVIDYCGEQATVVEDFGGPSITVDCGPDGVMDWRWTVDGASCTVISLPASETCDSFGP